MGNLLVPSAYPIDIVYQESNKELEIKNHFHNSYEIIYVLEGKTRYHINDKEYFVDKNSLVFINNMETHHVKVLEYPYKRYFILIKPDYFRSVIDEPILSSIFRNRSDSFRHVIELGSEGLREINDIIENLYYELNKKEAFWEAAVKSDLYRLFIILYRNYQAYFPLRSLNSSMQTITEIQKYIEEHYLEQISLEDISKLFFMDKYYLSHLFKKVTGFTFKEYIILQRISKAKDLLFHTNDDIIRVCMNSGFNNVNHFIRIFKKYEGTTPYQYRKRYR
ncbi:MAG TPA: AraC family transcriptional regulator [Clostridiaceae bacterium]|nr:AraC family transcriptional regulator [Clostridiaceae bacterium]